MFEKKTLELLNQNANHKLRHFELDLIYRMEIGINKNYVIAYHQIKLYLFYPSARASGKNAFLFNFKLATEKKKCNIV